ncbi:protein ALWAYS EARLY 3 isoform X2 [Ricinus communis]|uniref:protein ALWAYS EARLY 3 isoform X2 n=1 Tax=Ricinus communis TaxID=3988 RepID=UPI000772A5A8|nr:protein ALWAYS EARLY 3 isoform X2 [Ricinus communis]|eukprot:XP_015573347.1 protein ALWAYS EARLY 3 isoform X2 [Ricinus communis]
MAPSRKSRSVNKRFSYINEATSNKTGENDNRRRQRKRKLSDMLGPQWSKEELERFYRAYRKHGKDWGKVAAAVRDRSVEMVEALYTMNRAYLNLPKGYASAAGLIAMMTDHYTNLEESDSEQEITEPVVAPRKPQKRSRGTKELDASPVPDLMQSQSAASNFGCLSLLKKRRSGGRPWAVGKRTPRVPVSFSYDKASGQKYISPIRPDLKLKADALDDDVAHEIALVLTEASQRAGSPQASQTPNGKAETPSLTRNGEHMHVESEMTSSKPRGSEMDEGGCELSLGSTEADMEHYARDKRLTKGKGYHGRKPEVEDNIDNSSDDIKEACSGTEEGQKLGAIRGKFEVEVVGTKFARSSNKGPRKRSKKVLFGEGEADAVDALQTLADMSLRLPEALVDTESSVHVDDQKTKIVAKSKLKGNHSTAGVKVASPKTTKGRVFLHDVSPIPKVKDAVHQISAGIGKRRKKSQPSKILEIEERVDSYLGDSQKVEATDDVGDLISKGKSSHDTGYQKQGRPVKPSELNSSTDHGRESNDSAPSSIPVLSSKQFNLPTKVRSRRKINTPKPLLDKDNQSSEDIVNGQYKIAIPSIKDSAVSLKKKLSNCLSSYLVRRWSIFEWFYSAIDYPWFAKREFVEYLDHVGLGHIPRLTRVEWGVIRSSLGKPRRFSEQFLSEEKEKLNQYRESVRKHYTELRAGTRDGLPTDLARPLSVGQRIIALHPKTREIHDGSVLTVDHNRCRIQFDQPELGVELVMDVDCMPLNPLENMPASLTRQTVVFNRFIENLNELKMNGQPVERNMEGYIKFASCENMENTDGLLHSSPSTHHISNLMQHGKGYLANYSTHVATESGESVINQQAVNTQPFILAHIQAKDADIQALSDLTRALDKKEAVVSELKRMNDEVENEKDGENSLKDSELFKKHYAAVLFQLNEVNEQVSSALLCLRQRNTYQGNNPQMWMKPMTYIGEPVGHCSLFDRSADETQESGSHVAEIVETSRAKAQTMVDAAMQAMSSLKKEGSNIEEAIDFVNNQLSADDLSTSAVRSSIPANSVHSTVASQDQSSSCTTNLGPNSHAPETDMDHSPEQSEAQIPSEIITQCVATLLMIQKCTERQFPPSDVAQVLDSAVTSLKPCCSQNLPIYADIQKCMGIIRNQILALIPT